MTITEPSPPTPIDAPPADPRRWRALGVLSLVQFILVLDITVVNVALPHIRTDLGFSRAGLPWVVDSYVLTCGGLLLLGGRLADLVGRRRMFLLGIGLFAVASAASGAATSPGMLIASRFGQGAAEAMAAPAAFGLIALLFPDGRERAKAIGVFGGIAGLGGTLGPVISGVIVDNLDWRWIFYINVPVAVFTVLAVRRLVSESRASLVTRSGIPDVAGAALATGGLVAVVYGLIEAATQPWASAAVTLPLTIGAALLAAFVVRERRAAHPLVPLRFFDNRTRVTANAVTLCFTSVFFTVFFLMTLYLQQVQGYSPLRTGLAYLPFGVGISVGIGLSANLVTRIGLRALLASGFALASGGVAWLSLLTVHASYVSGLLPGMALMALGSGLCFCGFSNASVHGVSGEDASLASGVQNAMQQVGGAVGLAVLATLALRHADGEVRHGVGAAAASTAGTALSLRVGAVILAVGAVAVLIAFERVRVQADGSPAAVTA